MNHRNPVRVKYAAVGTITACVVTIAGMLVSAAPLRAQDEGVILSAAVERPLAITRRKHLRERLNERYLGQTRTETRIFIRPQADRNATPGNAERSDTSARRAFEGTVLQFSDTIQDRVVVGRPVEYAWEFAFTLDEDDRRRSALGSPLPPIWGFPSFPSTPVAPGDAWHASGEYHVSGARDQNGDRQQSGLLLPFTASYRYEGLDTWQGHPVHRVGSTIRLRFPLPPAPEAEDAGRQEREEAYRARIAAAGAGAGVRAVEAVHRAEILLSVDTRRPIMMNERIAQQVTLQDGEVIRREGFQLHWFTEPEALDEAEIARQAESRRIADLQVQRRSSGIALVLEAIAFEPESARLQPQERERLRSIAELLEGVADHSILVVGHTAAVGTPEGRQALSQRRAEVVATQLAEFGVDPARLLHEGRGGREPIADNSTAAGRRRNRRVELIILEDAAARGAN